jgi:uncharacterized protein with GYD domain
MLFCITANYTPQSLNAIMDHPDTNRFEAAKRLAEAAGGKMVALYSTASEGPGVMAIVDVPDASSAMAMSGVLTASGGVQNVKFMRLMLPEEVAHVRKKAAEIRGSYKAPGK